MYHVGMFVEYVTPPTRVVIAVGDVRRATGAGFLEAKDLVVGHNLGAMSHEDSDAISALAKIVAACINDNGGVARFVEDGSALGQ